MAPRLRPDWPTRSAEITGGYEGLIIALAAALAALYAALYVGFPLLMELFVTV
jgi:hypothetical protein